jgi:hypothetical protein
VNNESIKIGVSLNSTEAVRGIGNIRKAINDLGTGARQASDVFGRSMKQLADQAKQSAGQIHKSFSDAFGGIKGLIVSLGAAGFGASAIQKAFDFDKQRVQLAAFVGGVDNANRKIAEFGKTAQATAGVTRNNLLGAFIDLKAQAKLADDQATKLAVSIAKLQALYPKAQNTAQNLAQIFNQNFELGDVKQERGQTGDFIDSVIKRLGFEGPKAVELIRKAKEAGKLTQKAYWDAVDAEVQVRAKNLVETLETRQVKAMEGINDKLAKIGEKLFEVWEKVGSKVLPVVERVLDLFGKLPASAQAVAVGFAAIGPGAFSGVSALVQLSGALGGVRAALASLAAFAVSPAGIAALALIGAGTAIYGFNQMIAQNEANLKSQFTNKYDRPFLPGADVTEKLDLDPSLNRFQLVNGKVVPVKPNAGGGGGNTRTRRGGALRSDGSTSIYSGVGSEKRYAKAVKDAQDDLLKARNEYLDGIISDMEQISEDLNAANKQAASDAEFRRRRLIDQRQSRVQLTAEQNTRDAATRFRSAQRGYNATERSLNLGLQGIDQNTLLTPEERLAAQRGLLAGNAVDQQTALNKLLAAQTDENRLDEQWIENAQDKIDLLKQQSQGIDMFKASLEGFNSTLRTSEDVFRSFGQQVGSAFDDLSNVFTKVRDSFRSLLSSVVSNTLKTAFFNAVRPLQQSAVVIAGGVAGTAAGVGGVMNAVGSVGGSLGNNFAQRENFRTLSEALAEGKLRSVLSVAPSVNDRLESYAGPYNFEGEGAGKPFRGFLGGGPSVADSVAPPVPSPPPSPVKQPGYFSGLLGSLKSSFTNPFTLAGIGSYLGGQSTLGNLLGAGAGLAAGWGISMGASVFSAAGGGLGALGPAALAAAGPLALIAAPLVVGSILLGKAKQRKADEKVVDTYWVEYSRVLKELTSGVNSDRIMGDDALAQAAEARQTAVDLISQIKTKSVRESRLRNQIPQIDRYDLKNLQDAVAAQRTRLAQNADDLMRRRDLDSRLVPEFDTGGVVPGLFGAKVPAYVHAGEVVLNNQQRAAIGDDTLADAGVPGVRGGGSGGLASGQPIEVVLIAGTETQDQFYVNGVSSKNTRGATAQTMNRILRYG